MVFDEVPVGFNPKLHVSACFLEHNQTTLFLKRADFVTQGNTWAIPGGKVRDDESPEQACIREVREEASIQISDPIFVKTVYIRYPEYDYIYHIFRAPLPIQPDVKLKKDEVVNFAWLNRQEVEAFEAHGLLILDEMPCIERTYGAGPFVANQDTQQSLN